MRPHDTAHHCHRGSSHARTHNNQHQPKQRGISCFYRTPPPPSSSSSQNRAACQRGCYRSYHSRHYTGSVWRGSIPYCLLAGFLFGRGAEVAEWTSSRRCVRLISISAVRLVLRGPRPGPYRELPQHVGGGCVAKTPTDTQSHFYWWSGVRTITLCQPRVPGAKCRQHGNARTKHAPCAHAEHASRRIPRIQVRCTSLRYLYYKHTHTHTHETHSHISYTHICVTSVSAAASRAHAH